MVVGLDLSCSGTGLVVVQAGRTKPLRKRLYKTEGLGPNFKDGQRRGLLLSGKFRGNDQERINWLKRKVRTNIRKFQPDFVLIEGYAYGARGRGLSITHELGGVIKDLLFELDVPFSTLSPTSLKLAFAGNGKASKQDMIRVAQMFDRSIINDNVADAFALAVYAQDNFESLHTERF